MLGYKSFLLSNHARPANRRSKTSPIRRLQNTTCRFHLTTASEGEKTHRSVDLFGRVYEYFLTHFASAGGKNTGRFYTPSCVVRLLVEELKIIEAEARETDKALSKILKQLGV